MSVTLLTSLGDLKVELFAQEVPKLSENFLALLASGTYSGTVFHRLMPGFIIQGGDPTGTGKGGECVWGGVLPDDFGAPIRHDQRGVVSMANGGPDGNGSQFFITFAAAPHLDGVNSIIGRVIGGEDTLEKMEAAPVQGKKHRPAADIKVLGAVVHANPFA
jgi:peptidyl-prolyl cis-trans isomerase-like 3